MYKLKIKKQFLGWEFEFYVLFTAHENDDCTPHIDSVVDIFKHDENGNEVGFYDFVSSERGFTERLDEVILESVEEWELV